VPYLLLHETVLSEESVLTSHSGIRTRDIRIIISLRRLSYRSTTKVTITGYLLRYIKCRKGKVYYIEISFNGKERFMNQCILRQLRLTRADWNAMSFTCKLKESFPVLLFYNYFRASFFMLCTVKRCQQAKFEDDPCPRMSGTDATPETVYKVHNIAMINRLVVSTIFIHLKSKCSWHYRK
jgi:hypothetical protein